MAEDVKADGTGTTDAVEPKTEPKTEAKVEAKAEAPKAEPKTEPAKTEPEQTQKPGAPEKYALTSPDESVVPTEGLTVFEAEARDLGLTNEQAQAVLDKRVAAFGVEAQAILARTTADPTYGGAQLAQSQKLAASVLDRFAPATDPLFAELRETLRSSRMGDALPVVAFLAKIGKAMAEDRPPAGGLGAGAEKPTRLEDRMYAGSTSKPEPSA